MLSLSNEAVQKVLDTRLSAGAPRGEARGGAAYAPRIDIHAPTGIDDD